MLGGLLCLKSGKIEGRLIVMNRISNDMVKSLLIMDRKLFRVSVHLLRERRYQDRWLGRIR